MGVGCSDPEQIAREYQIAAAQRCKESMPKTITDKVIEAKGDNKVFGSGGSIHRGIGNDFKFTENGMERKD
jgi:hypothetical protein